MTIAADDTARAGSSHWIKFAEQTAERLVADPSVGSSDPEEKDYAWADVDLDGDIDLVVVRKQPITTPGGRRNVLLINVDGVLTDRTAELAASLLDATNDRDVKLVDVNNDTWPDLVTAATCDGCDAGVTNESRLYLNLGDGGTGDWLGFGAPEVLFTGGHNFSAVAVGDLTGDGYADLYFVSYNDTLEDQLLINGGPDAPGQFTEQSSERLTLAMRQSGFGTNAVIADFNGDGFNDIAKSEMGPVEIFYNDGSGFFTVLDQVSQFAHYYVEAGDLNGDGRLDLVIADDGIDSFLLNQGNGEDGFADFVTFFLPDTTGGFGNNVLIADLDGQGFNDIIVTDVAIDVSGCQRITDILRNDAHPPMVAFDAGPTGIPAAMLAGVYDIAVFDINGDGFQDLVTGRCSGTQIWMGLEPIGIAFAFPGGLLELIEPDVTTTVEVEIEPFGGVIEPGTTTLHFSVNGGAFVQTTLESVGENLYEAILPAGDCLDIVDFYVSAGLGGVTFSDPADAPLSTYAATVANVTELMFSDAMEGDVSGWTIISDPSLTGGEWEQADPNGTLFQQYIVSPEDDATPNGTMAFITENGPPGGSTGASDVDNGPTYLISPAFDLEGADALISYARWAVSILGTPDHLQIEVSNDDGANWKLVESVEETVPLSAWQTAVFQVGRFVPPTAEVRVRFSISDTPQDSLTEAGIDDFEVTRLACAGGCPWDLDGGGDVGITDFLDLLALWGTDPGGPPDFDGDGNVGILDFLELLAHWGPCP